MTCRSRRIKWGDRVLVWIAFAAAFPISLGIATRFWILSVCSLRLNLTAWCLFVSGTLFWVSLLLPSLSNVRGWDAPETRGIVSGLIIGATVGLMLLLFAQIRSYRRRKVRGFPINQEP
jgi:hypothetical protein